MPKVLSLAFAILVSILSGEDPINDPYEAAIVAAEVTGLDDRVTGRGYGGKVGTSWLVGSSMAGTRLTDLRKLERRRYNGTAIHRVDSRYGKRKYFVAVKRGWLRPDTCPHHVDTGRVEARGERPYAGWSTRGPYDADIYNKFKIMSQYTGTDCFPPSYFDIPLFSAIAASEYAIAMCDRHGRRSRKRPCDRHFLRCIWAGIGYCQDPVKREKIQRKFTKWNRRARRLMRERGDLPPLPASWVRRARVKADMDDGARGIDELPVPPPRPRDR